MKQQRGMALLVVLLLLSIMALLASQMTVRYRQMWQHSHTLLTQLQMREYLSGGEAFAARVLYQDLLDSPQKTSRAQYWATQQDVWPINEVSLRAEIRDEQACFNINSLQNHDENHPDNLARYREKVFVALLHNLEVENLRARQLAAALEDWLDANRDLRLLGAEDHEYMALKPPYLPANQPIRHLSELRAVAGMDAALYRTLMPFVCALPERDLAVNINTLQQPQAALLSALFLNTLPVQTARDLIERRPPEGWQSVDQFLALVPGSHNDERVAGPEIARALTVNSDYFVASIAIENQQQRSRMISHFYRTSDRKVVVRSREMGVLP
ncbi:general secretion pathway protein GspK [Buttiauxella warmboldiae]|uniref:Type II secretion system protein K n=1 Tax=Buttiauxella warmboldiae TaxID=82993 RepID=A0A3N5ECA0_9ENTR|nr:type II secretion system minor pseudopilin GspK [Buttiauxella warmboldiae]RPH30133.1 general secretion pathway protein GspK [Buttiauxella warmboldiae]